MKRLLYGTTALVAAGTLMAGPANAAGLEASLNGYMEQWFGFSDQDEDTTDGPPGAGAEFNNAGFSSDSEVHFNAIATLDNGLKVQYAVELEGNTSGDQIDESYLRLTASWGQIVFGSENSAMYLMGYGPDQFGVTTLSGDSSQWINAGGQAGGGSIFATGANPFRTPWGSANIEVDGSCNDDKKLTYFTPRFSGFQFGASYSANCLSQDVNGLTAVTDASIENIVSLGANYVQKFDQVSVAISGGYAFAEKPAGNTGDDPKAVIVGAKIGFGGFSIGGYYGDHYDAMDTGGGTFSNENMGWAVGGSYATGPWGVSLVYAHGEREGLVADSAEDERDIVELGVKYSLGPGVSLHGSVYWIDYEAETNAAGLAAGEFDNDGFAVVGGMKVSF